ncbi:cell division protease FtsH [Natranaerovirga pectinivora]|uniref:ATP-dependent zinc metalloprotease FtsH n=2 Tax=Natranaerovirga pectinivora TaxID=682400 RepID=A0A4R3MI99_9FIRM|nr:cell division protease FtsH [Natranaerovirga pectinivora]
MKKNMKGLSFYALLLVVLLFAVVLSSSDEKRGDAYGYKQFLNDLEGNQIRYIQIKPNAEVPTGSVKVDFIDNSSRTFFVSNTNQVELDVREYNIDREMLDVPRPNWLLSLLPSIIALGVVIFLFFFIMNQAQGGGGGSRVMNFGKSRAKMVVDDKKTITFKNVAGLDEEKEELEELVEFLKSPRKFVELGARIPKGVLLVGPPGTGKTLLAKAVAGEAGVPFFSISGSDFVEMFVGVGASRVRDLFEQAKKNSPCIIFIDEIDAVGRKRGAGLGGGHDEREQTLNQLLVEMDGFGINEGVIVVAATNRVDILDPALLRPGRFDRKVVVGRPDAKGREEILKVHGKGKPLSDDVDFRAIARSTSGFTGADLENLLNEAAIFAARENKKVIEQEDIHRAFIKVGIGTEKKSRVITEKEKKITAYHEAGHAIMHEILSEIDPVHSISIIPTGFAGGYTMSIPAEDTYYETKTKMEQEIIALLGGRAAEKLVLDDITTGASNDIERATKIASGMVTKFGMSDVLGPIQFGDNNEEVFIGRDWGHTRNYGENIAGLIDSEIKGIIDSSYNKAIKILNENIEVLHKTAEVLLEKEKISGIEFKALFNEFSPSI